MYRFPYPMQPVPHEGQQRQQLPQALRLKAVEVEALIVDRRILGDRHAAAVETAVADGELDRAQGFGTSLMRHARLENMAGPASLECADRVAKDTTPPLYPSCEASRHPPAQRSEERRVGKAGVRTGR